MDLNLGDNTIPVSIEFRVNETKSLTNMKTALASFEKNVKGSIDISVSAGTKTEISALKATMSAINTFKFGALKQEIGNVGKSIGNLYTKMNQMGEHVDKFNKATTKMGDHTVQVVDRQIGALDRLMSKLAEVRAAQGAMNQTNGSQASYAAQGNPFQMPKVNATGSNQSVATFNKAMEAVSRNANADLLSAAKAIEGVGKGLNGALGVFDRQLKAIRVKTGGRSAADIEKTIVHELTHAAVDMLPQVNKDKLMAQIKADLAKKGNNDLRALKAEIEQKYAGKIKHENELLEEVFVHAVERAYAGMGTGNNAKMANSVQRFMDTYFKSQAKVMNDASSRYAYSLPNQPNQPKMTAGQARAQAQGQGASGSGGGPNDPHGTKNPRLPNPERIKAVAEAYRGLVEVLHNADFDGFVAKLDNTVRHLTAQKAPIREYITEIQTLNKALNSLSKDAPTVKFHVTGNLGATINNAAGAAVGGAAGSVGVRNAGGVHGVLEPGNELLNKARAEAVAKYASSNPDSVLTKIQRELDANGDIIRRYVVKMGGFFYKMKENAMTGEREIESLNKRISESASGLVLNDAGAKSTSKYLQNLANDATATIVKTVHGVNGMTQIIERSIHDAQGQLQKVYDVHNIDNSGKVKVQTFDNLSGSRRDRLGEALSAVDPSARDAGMARATSGEEYRRLQKAVDDSDKALRHLNAEVRNGNISFTEAQGKIDAEIKKLKALGDASGMAQAKIRELTQAQKGLNDTQRMNDRSVRANLFLGDLDQLGKQQGIKRINKQDITGVARDRETNRIVQTSTDVVKVGNSYLQVTKVMNESGKVIDVTTKALKNHADALRAVSSLTGKTQRSIFSMVETAGRVILSYGLITQSVQAFKSAIESAITGANKLEQAQFDIKKILNIETGKDDKGAAVYQNEIQQKETLNNLQEKAIAISRTFGSSREEVLGVTRDFIALYQNEADAINGTVSASKLAIATNIQLGESTKYLTAVATQFKLTAKGVDEFVDKINQVTNLDPTVKADLLIQNIQRVGPAAYAAGVSMDKVIALTTVGMKTFGSATAEIGNALKTFLQFVSSSDKQGVIAKFLGTDKKSLDGTSKDDLITRIQQRVVELQKKSLDLSKTGRAADLKQAERIKGEIDQFFSKYGGATQGSRLTGIFGDQKEVAKLLGADGKIKDAAGSARKEAAIQLQSLTNIYNSTLASMQILGERVGLAVIPTIKSVLREAKDLFIQIDNNRATLQEGLQRLAIIVSPIGSVFKGAFEDVRDTIGAIAKGVQLLTSLFKFDKTPVSELKKEFEGVNEIARQLGKTLAAIGIVALGAKLGSNLKDRVLGTASKFGGDSAAGAAFTGQVATAGATFTSEVISAGAAFAAEVQAGGAISTGKAVAGEAGMAAANAARTTAAAGASGAAASAATTGFFSQLAGLFVKGFAKPIQIVSDGLFGIGKVFENFGVKVFNFGSKLTSGASTISNVGSRVGGVLGRFGTIFETIGTVGVRAGGIFAGLGTKLAPVLASMSLLAQRLLPGVATGLLGLLASAVKFMAHPAVQLALAVGHVGVRLHQTNQAAEGVSASYNAKTESIDFANKQVATYQAALDEAKKQQAKIDSNSLLSPEQKLSAKSESGRDIQKLQQEISDLNKLIETANSEGKNLATFQSGSSGPIGSYEDVYGITHESRLVERKKALDDSIQAINDRLGEARSIEEAKRGMDALTQKYTNNSPTTSEGAKDTSVIVEDEKNKKELSAIDKIITLAKRRIDMVNSARQANEITTGQEIQGLKIVLNLNIRDLEIAQQKLKAKYATAKDDDERNAILAKQLQISELLRDNARAVLESQKKLYTEVVQLEESRVAIATTFNELEGDSTKKSLNTFSIRKQELNIELAKLNAFTYAYEKSLQTSKVKTGDLMTASRAINLESQAVEIAQQKAAVAQKIVALGTEYKNVLEQQFKIIGQLSNSFGSLIGTDVGQAAATAVNSNIEALKTQQQIEVEILRGQDAKIESLKTQLQFYKDIAAYQTAIENQTIDAQTFGTGSSQQAYAKTLMERDRLVGSRDFANDALYQANSQVMSSGAELADPSKGVGIRDIQNQAQKVKAAIAQAVQSGEIPQVKVIKDLQGQLEGAGNDPKKLSALADAVAKFSKGLQGLTPEIKEEINAYNALNTAFTLNNENVTLNLELLKKEYELKVARRAIDSELAKARMDELGTLEAYLDMQDKLDDHLGRTNMFTQASRDDIRRSAQLGGKRTELSDVESELDLERSKPISNRNIGKLTDLLTRRNKLKIEIEGIRDTVNPLRKALIDIGRDFSDTFREGFSAALAKTLSGPDIEKLRDLTVKVRELKEKGQDYNTQIADSDREGYTSILGEPEFLKQQREVYERAANRTKLIRERNENAEALAQAEKEKAEESNPLLRFGKNFKESSKKKEQEANEKLFEFIGKAGADFLTNPAKALKDFGKTPDQLLKEASLEISTEIKDAGQAFYDKIAESAALLGNQRKETLGPLQKDILDAQRKSASEGENLLAEVLNAEAQLTANFKDGVTKFGDYVESFGKKIDAMNSNFANLVKSVNSSSTADPAPGAGTTPSYDAPTKAPAVAAKAPTVAPKPITLPPTGNKYVAPRLTPRTTAAGQVEAQYDGPDGIGGTRARPVLSKPPTLNDPDPTRRRIAQGFLSTGTVWDIYKSDVENYQTVNPIQADMGELNIRLTDAEEDLLYRVGKNFDARIPRDKQVSQLRAELKAKDPTSYNEHLRQFGGKGAVAPMGPWPVLGGGGGGSMEEIDFDRTDGVKASLTPRAYLGGGGGGGGGGGTPPAQRNSTVGWPIKPTPKAKPQQMGPPRLPMPKAQPKPAPRPQAKPAAGGDINGLLAQARGMKVDPSVLRTMKDERIDAELRRRSLRMAIDASKAGVKLQVTDGYRTMDDQWDRYHKYAGKSPVAYPSPNAPHIRGVAVDWNQLGPGQNSWMEKNSRKYGLDNLIANDPVHYGTLESYGQNYKPSVKGQSAPSRSGRSNGSVASARPQGRGYPVAARRGGATRRPQGEFQIAQALTPGFGAGAVYSDAGPGSNFDPQPQSELFTQPQSPRRPYEALNVANTQLWGGRFNDMKGNTIENDSSGDDDIMGAISGAIDKRAKEKIPTYFAGLDKNDVIKKVRDNLVEMGDTVESLSDKIYKSDLFRKPGQDALKAERPYVQAPQDTEMTPEQREKLMRDNQDIYGPRGPNGESGMTPWVTNDELGQTVAEFMNKLGIDGSQNKEYMDIAKALRQSPNATKDSVRDGMYDEYSEKIRERTGFGKIGVDGLPSLLGGLISAGAGDGANAFKYLGSYGAKKGTESLMGGIIGGGDPGAAFTKNLNDPTYGIQSQIGEVGGNILAGGARMFAGVKEEDRTEADKSGATAGAAVGATAGAVIGSAIPVIGTMLGAAVGGLAGNLIGGAIGDSIGGGAEKSAKLEKKRQEEELAKQEKDYRKKQMDLLKEQSLYQSEQVKYQRQAAENAKLNARYIGATGQTFKSAGELLQQDASFISASSLISGRYTEIPGLGDSPALKADASYAKVNTQGFNDGAAKPINVNLNGATNIGQSGQVEVPVKLVPTGAIDMPQDTILPVTPLLTQGLQIPDATINVNAKLNMDQAMAQKAGFNANDIVGDVHKQISQGIH